jgi:hypothetical protein
MDDKCNYICDNSLGCDYTECSDSIDNDQDSYIDYPLDLGCSDYYDDDESDGYVACLQDSDCGNVSTANSCIGLDFTVTTTIPVCMYAATEYSYCDYTYSQNITTCDYICSDTLGCDYYIRPRVYVREDPDLSVERIIFPENAKVYRNDILETIVVIRNSGDTDFDNVRVQVSIPDLGISRRAGPFELDEDESRSVNTRIFIPYFVEPGEYTARITLFDEESKRVHHRDVVII